MSRKEIASIFLIASVATLLRVWGNGFGLPYVFHADEPFIIKTTLNLVVNNDFNPHIFTWPPLFIYLNAPAYYLIFFLGKIWGLFPSYTEFLAYYTLAPAYFIRAIRITSAFFGVLSILPLYLLGRHLGHPKVGLLAAALLAVSPLHVENSHFGKVDITLVFFILCATYFLYVSYLHGRIRDYLLFGLSAGLATAAKYPAGLLVIALFLLSPLILPRHETKPWYHPHGFYPLLVSLSTYLLALFLGAPHIFLDFRTFWQDFTNLSSMTAIPWLGGEKVGSRFVFYAKLLLVEDFGPLMGIFWVAGVLIFATRKPRVALVLLAFPVLYYCFFGLSANVFTRYGLPLLPTVLLFVAYAVWWISEVGPVKRRRLHHAVFLLIALVFLYSGAVGALRVGYNLSKADTRIIAKEWIETHIPPGTKIVREYYGPPLTDFGQARSRSQARQLLLRNEIWIDWVNENIPITEPFYHVSVLPVPWPQEMDTAGKMFYSLPQYLEDGTEFIIVDSNMYGRYLAAPEKYPLQTAFYSELEQRAERIQTWNPQELNCSGPEIKMYQMPRATSAASTARPLVGERP